MLPSFCLPSWPCIPATPAADSPVQHFFISRTMGFCNDGSLYNWFFIKLNDYRICLQAFVLLNAAITCCLCNFWCNLCLQWIESKWHSSASTALFALPIHFTPICEEHDQQEIHCTAQTLLLLHQLCQVANVSLVQPSFVRFLLAHNLLRLPILSISHAGSLCQQDFWA